jgi:hypothetical protein
MPSARRLFLNGGSSESRSEEMTAFLVASEPVPAVVGTATTGSGSRSNCSPRPTPSRKSFTVAP